MQTYRIASLVDKPRRSSVILPGIEPSIGAETSVLRAERQMLREMAAWTRENVLPAYDRTPPLVGDAVVQDIDEWVWSEFDRVASRLVAVEAETVRRVLRLEAIRHTDKFMAAAKRALGIDLSAVVREDDLGAYLDQAGARSASLISGLADDVRKKIKDRTITAVLQGETSANLRKTLAKEFGLADNRAKVIARDQISKVTSDLNKIRHQQAGITEYVWSTAHDERVRALHRSLDGKTYAYGEQTGAEQGLPPGQPIMCRCIARAIVEF